MALPPSAIAAVLAATVAVAQPPAGYYASVNAANAATLRATLHAVIDDHRELPYTSSSTDTWDVLEIAQQDPSNATRILDVYRNTSYVKAGGANNDYNREHGWPQSYGFAEQLNHGPYTDCHSLFLCNDSYNSARLNNPYATCAASCTEYPTVAGNGGGGGTGVYPGNSNWRSTTSGAYGTWEVWGGRRGDLARALFYLDVRYEGGTHGVTHNAEPDLILTNDRSLIAASASSMNLAVAHMGLLATLLQWHLDDPPDARELARNDVVYSFQQNRNPFVDHPEWVGIVWGVYVPGTTAYFGTGCAGQVGGTPLISATTAPRIDANASVSLFAAPPNEIAALQLAHTSVSIDLGVAGFTGCTLYVIPIVTATTTSSLFGGATFTFPVPNHANLIGQHLFAQWLVIDSVESGIVATRAADMLFGS